mmetsp:Transcript_13341/g.21821  ORF Transcript_13341/g.21821 Transcript_13341/m.21821 type:complete len:152 (+) Transcript_13341:503-958(+)
MSGDLRFRKLRECVCVDDMYICICVYIVPSASFLFFSSSWGVEEYVTTFTFRTPARQLILKLITNAFSRKKCSCRGEDVKLVYEQSVGWQASLVDEKGREIEIKDSSWDAKDRPEYKAIEDKINEILPEPLWMRMMQEASEKGLKFQRKEE